MDAGAAAAAASRSCERHLIRPWSAQSAVWRSGGSQWLICVGKNSARRIKINVHYPSPIHRRRGRGVPPSARSPDVARAQAPIVIKFSHVVADDTPKGKGSRKFAELAEKYTAGKVKVEVYPNSSALQGQGRDRGAAARRGADARALDRQVRPARRQGVRGARPAVRVQGHRAAYVKTVNGDAGKWLMTKLEPKGVKGLALLGQRLPHDVGQQAADQAGGLPGPEDAHPGSKVARRSISGQMGMIPQVMAFSEVYQALQTGVVDGSENLPSNIYTQKFHEVQKHITVAEHAPPLLRGDHQRQVLGRPAGRRARRPREGDGRGHRLHQQHRRARRTTTSLEAIKKSGKSEIHVLTPSSARSGQDKMQPTYKWAEGRVGKEAIDPQEGQRAEPALPASRPDARSDDRSRPGCARASRPAACRRTPGCSCAFSTGSRNGSSRR